MTSTPWSDDRVATLTKLWADGLSASEIAARLGGVTRNAVLGKLHRLGLLGGRARVTVAKPRPLAAAPRQRRARRSGPRKPRAAPGPQAAVPDWPGLVDRLERLRPHDCRWPIGDPLQAGFSFCGRQAASGPYCPAHHAAAHAPVAKPGGREGAMAD
jgi:GcrA cell cycle regulator